MKRKEKKEIKDKVAEIINAYGYNRVYPVPVENIAIDMGYEVFLVDFNEHEDPDLNNVSGMVSYEEKKMFINSLDGNERRRFTIAHEIGHILLHGKEITEDNNGQIDYRNYMFSDDNKENEANYFAANLLMPEDVFKKAWRVLGRRADAVGDFFGVSRQAAQVRANWLKLKCI